MKVCAIIGRAALSQAGKETQGSVGNATQSHAINRWLSRENPRLSLVSTFYRFLKSDSDSSPCLSNQNLFSPSFFQPSLPRIPHIPRFKPTTRPERKKHHLRNPKHPKNTLTLTPKHSLTTS